jgi:hypothetical protein
MFSFISFISSSSHLSSSSSSFRLNLNFFQLIVASDSESVIERMIIASCDSSFNLTQNQMFLQFEEYVKQKLHSLSLNIEINKDNINDMKENVKDVIINCRKMQELITT